ncbi:MAG: TIGR01212 family radical SAM protein [Lachnospiraceae bacterium]|nr:TIGR01212 family radical SAM protein [Lachnospiraceae bacterium]
MTSWHGKPYYSLDSYLKNTYGRKMYKVSLDAGMTCPNRDGTLDHRGCIFCSTGGSGDFAGDRAAGIHTQIDDQIRMIQKKSSAQDFIAYFQAYTNTYAPLSYLKDVYMEALEHPSVAILDIATRPDCLPDEVLDLLEKLNRKKPVWVELGLQTIHPSTAAYIRRGYDLSCFEDAVRKLHTRNIPVIVHTILGLPGENVSDALATIQYLNQLPIFGIKLQLLHVLKNTDLAADYEKGMFRTLEQEEYLDLVITCLQQLSPDIVVHRVTGDGPKKLLISPLWSGNKRAVLNRLHRKMALGNFRQGQNFVVY